MALRMEVLKMTAIDITYEDGLRLSELSGQLAGLKYEASNLLAVNAADLMMVFFLLTMVAIVVAIFLYIITEYCGSWRYILIALPSFIPILGIIVFAMYLDASVAMDIANVQGQIDAILAKYEGML